jgi:chitinase
MELKQRTLVVAASLAVVLAIAAPGPARDDPNRGDRDKRLVGYFIEWGIYGRGYFVKNIQDSDSAGRMTHVNYAFANVAPASASDPTVVCQIADSWADYVRPATVDDAIDGVAESYDESVLHGSFNQLRKLKQAFPNLKVFISLGGFALSGHFSDAALTPESRTALVSSCVDMFIKGNLPPVSPGGPVVAAPGLFDGIDVDWEWPGNCIAGCPGRPEDKQNFTLLMKEFRRQLDLVGRQQRRHYGLSFFAPAGESNIDNLELRKLRGLVDFITLQGYDLHGSWESTTNFQSALFAPAGDPHPADAAKLNINFIVNAYLKRGVPPDKVVVGVPFYGRGWAGVPDVNHGLFQTSTGPAPGTFEAGIEDFKALKALEVTSGSFLDPSSKAHFIYSPTTGIFWGYDNEREAQTKGSYIRLRGLGGAMFWELSGDDATGSLVKALRAGMRDHRHH